MLVKGVSFLFGVSLLLYVANKQYALFIGLGLLSVSLLIYFVYRWRRAEQLKPVINTFQWLIFINLGALWGILNLLFWSYHSGAWLKQPQTAYIQGYICSIPYHQYDSAQFDFCIESVNNKTLSFTEINRFKFSWGKYAQKPGVPLQAGQTWRLKAKLRPAYGRYNESGFDYQKWLLAESYMGKGSVKEATLIRSFPQNLKRYFHNTRQKIYNEISIKLAASTHKAMLLALAMGERSKMTQQDWLILQHSGTSHLLAISGLHIGIAALWSYWLVFYLWRFLPFKLGARLCHLYPAQRVASIASLLGAFSLLLVSGFGLPAQRAFIMLAIFVISRWFGYYYRLSSILGIALFAVLLINPFSVLSISFWLSFIAVFVIAIILQNQLSAKNKLLEWVQLNTKLCLIMLVISVIFFDLLSLVSIIANIILIPLVSFILIPILYFALLLNLIIEPLAKLFYWLSDQVISLVYWLQFELTKINQLVAKFEIPLIGYIAIGFFILLMLLPNKLFSKKIYLPILMSLILAFSSTRPPKNFEMVVFDIGQGLAIWIQTPDGNLLYDTGWGNANYALATSVILPFLDGRKIKSIDKFIISHDDSDHSGGIMQVLEAQEVAEIISGEPLDTFYSTSCHDYPAWSWSGIQFKFIPHLPNTKKRQGNNASCVLAVKTAAGSILLTGDIQKQAERVLVDAGIEPFDILIAAHHGSNTSSTPHFVEQVKPKFVVFSAGYDNQWNFPKKAVVERFIKINSQIWITYRDGAIHITMHTADDSPKFKVNSQRKMSPHFWL